VVDSLILFSENCQAILTPENTRYPEHVQAKARWFFPRLQGIQLVTGSCQGQAKSEIENMLL
jgi:hypothetical protein